jgi:hypothetical protein
MAAKPNSTVPFIPLAVTASPPQSSSVAKSFEPTDILNLKVGGSRENGKVVHIKTPRPKGTVYFLKLARQQVRLYLRSYQFGISLIRPDRLANSSAIDTVVELIQRLLLAIYQSERDS